MCPPRVKKKKEEEKKKEKKKKRKKKKEKRKEKSSILIKTGLVLFVLALTMWAVIKETPLI